MSCGFRPMAPALQAARPAGGYLESGEGDVLRASGDVIDPSSTRPAPTLDRCPRRAWASVAERPGQEQPRLARGPVRARRNASLRVTVPVVSAWIRTLLLRSPSRSVPSSGSKMKPRMWSRQGSSGLAAGGRGCGASVASRSSKAPRRQVGQDAVGAERLGELVLGGAVQAAALVHHDDDLLGAEQALRRAERADRVVGHEPAGVADDVGVAALQPEHREEVDARVHARRARRPCGAGAG